MDKKELDKINRLVNQKGYTITVDNSKALTHNVNIDWPTFFCFALSEAEAIGKMMLSDFVYKNLKVINISTD